MLVLSRKKNERIICTFPDGTVLDVCVVDIRGDKVRLGLTAPQGITIHREEVQRAIDAEAAELCAETIDDKTRLPASDCGRSATLETAAVAAGGV